VRKDKGGLRELYPLLAHAYIRKFNRGYRDRFQELHFIQQSFLFTMYLLWKYGQQMAACRFLQRQFSQSILHDYPGS